jgi:hypothetical protein
LKALGQADAHLGVAATEHADFAREFAETIHDLCGICGNNDHVQVADRLAAAPIAAG